MHPTLRSLGVAAGLCLACTACVAAQANGFVAAGNDGNANTVYFLDEQMKPRSSFTVDDPFPDAVAATHQLIFAGYFLESSVVAYDHGGHEMFRWSDPGLQRVTGLAVVGDYLAASADNTIYLFEADTGRYVQQLTLDDSVEGLAYDGRNLWTVGSDLVARDFVTGNVVRRIPNAAIGCPFSGTGIATAGAGALMLGCTDGDWFEVSSLDGSVLASGNNGVPMFDLAALPAPELPAPLLLATGLLALGVAARRRLVPAIRLERMTYRLQGGCSTN